MFGRKNKIDEFTQTVLGCISSRPAITADQVVQQMSPSGSQSARVRQSIETLVTEGLVELKGSGYFAKRLISEEKVIWYPGIYGGYTEGPYSQKVADISLVDLTQLVQQRAKEDGEWSIANGFVGDNEDAMRDMMAFVSKEENIQQCVGHILKEGMENERTVDFVCRELANASKWAHGTSDD